MIIVRRTKRYSHCGIKGRLPKGLLMEGTKVLKVPLKNDQKFLQKKIKTSSYKRHKCLFKRTFQRSSKGPLKKFNITKKTKRSSKGRSKGPLKEDQKELS